MMKSMTGFGRCEHVTKEYRLMVEIKAVNHRYLDTLILAYIGSSLSTVLLLASSAESLLSLFNREMIVVEVLQAVVGSLGILFTIPATSLLAASVYQGKKPSRKQEMRMARKAAISGELNGKYDSLLKQNHPPKPEDTQK